MYKFISETEIQRYRGGFIVLNGKIHTNPDEETLRLAGYKNLIDSEKPEYDPETQYLEVSYQDGEDITVIYTVKNKEEEEEEE